jgi:hypothetical protein
MVTVTGPSLEREGIPFVGVKNNVLDGIGEAVWIPYFHRDAGPCWNLIFEAKADGPMDVFHRATNGAEALAAAWRTIETLTPWDADWARGMQLADELGWLAGRITPTVRKPVGRLPSGRMVTCIGDTAMHLDPLAAQGANNGTKMARHMVARVAARGDDPFDAAWMTETFEQFWQHEGRPAYVLTSLMLEPMSEAGRLMLIAQYGSDGVRRDGVQAIANLFALGFAEPAKLIDVLTDVTAARRTIREKTGKSWVRAVMTGALGIGRAQIRQKLGLSAGHPPERLAARA